MKCAAISCIKVTSLDSQTGLKKESRTQHKQASQKKSETKQVKEAITDNKNATQTRQRESARLKHDNEIYPIGTRKEKLNDKTSPGGLHASQTCLTQKKVKTRQNA